MRVRLDSDLSRFLRELSRDLDSSPSNLLDALMRDCIASYESSFHQLSPEATDDIKNNVKILLPM